MLKTSIDPLLRRQADIVAFDGGNWAQIKGTVTQIGEAIRAAHGYLPIRNWAASVAANPTIKPKDYVGQARAIFNELTKKRRWSYVKDPFGIELVTKSPEALWKLVLAGDGVGVGRGRGAGDCDCITAALGASLLNIGLPVRLAISAPTWAKPRQYGHVFLQSHFPGHGWVTLDPVAWPAKPFGHTSKFSQLAIFDLSGKLLGEYQRKEHKMNFAQSQEIPNLSYWRDYGLAGTDEPEPADWRANMLHGFGAFAEQRGMIDGSLLSGLSAEVDWSVDQYGQPKARTPMLELSQDDYDYVRQNGAPYLGMLALGDTGDPYMYTEISEPGLGRWGFFKRLWRRAKKFGRRIMSGAKRLIKRLPGGKYMVKLGEKVWKISMKLVRPLVKFVGKYAAKLAPIAALIPGWGPAIAAGLFTAGKVANLMQKYGVGLIGLPGKVRRLASKDPRAIHHFRVALNIAAKQAAQARGRVRA